MIISDGHECSKNKNWGCSFAEIRPYLGPTVRIKQTTMYVGYTYNFDQIAEMESIAYLWRDGDIVIQHHNILGLPIVAEDFQPILSFSYFAIVHYIRYYISPKTILNSPTILQCRNLIMNNAHFSYKDCKALYSVKVIEIYHGNNEIDPDSWLQFLDQPGVKPIVVLRQSRREVVDNVLNRFVKAFSSAVSPNAFKIVFAELDDPVTEFRETNNISGEVLELKKGVPAEYCKAYHYNFMLERSSL
ncbi:hypothetical protein DdX_16037 [Ditylenchus destructor]|uniref:Uncharacterized protein n=1 Tax=Ditylenchus destructor TaxID=166010 RepID=A0AAD4R0F0_9BILA|nr:hypothetical protein DdX_16037 [Ditylenchus destructor]